MRDPFAYHASTPVTAPRYAAIREAAAVCGKAFEDAMSMSRNLDREMRHTLINDASREFAGRIRSICPGSGDIEAAVENVRLARMRANETIVSSSQLDWKTPLIDARMWACAAIALCSEAPTQEADLLRATAALNLAHAAGVGEGEDVAVEILPDGAAVRKA